FEAALPPLADLLGTTWADGCAIGLWGGDGGVRIIATAGKAPKSRTFARRPVDNPSVSTLPGGKWALQTAIAVHDDAFGFIWLTGDGDEPSSLLSGLAQELAVRIAIAIDAAKAIAREHHIAEALQRSLLPERLHAGHGLVLSAAYRPAAGESIVSGDWYDAFELSDGRIGLSIGDVAGHGLSAAVVMSEARQAVRASAFDADTPGEALARANQMLQRAPMMVTALLGIYDPKIPTFTYASAGHPPPIVQTPSGHRFMLPVGDLPLGVDSDTVPSSWTFSLQPGTLLLLYTDGLVEYSRDILAGEAALLAAVGDEFGALSSEPATNIVERVFGVATNGDDVAAMTLYVEPRPMETFEVTASAVPFTAPFIRRPLESWLSDRGLDADRRFTIISAVGEAIANAIEHAYTGTPGIVRLSVRFENNMVRVFIEDGGVWRPAEKRDERGRGIPLMRALMDRVEIRTDRTSTRVRMQLQTI
ncbi:MAG: ATP-binding SpoIIE family protein phosphatase, partial [Vulcanimicrobiaceae bacterium]